MEQSTKKWIGVAAVVGAVAVVVVAIIVFATGNLRRVQTVAESVPEAVEAVVSDAEKELREELRPVRGKERLLIFAIDGLGRDELKDLLDEGSAPVTAKFLGSKSDDAGLFERGYLAADTLSILPSSTIAAWSTIFTGSLPAQTGVPGNEFFLRENTNFYAIAPTSVPSREHALQAVNDGMLNKLIEVPTLYEQADLRAHVSMSQVYRGADVFTMSESALLEFIVATTKSPSDTDDKIDRSKYEALDTESFDALHDALQEHGIPDIQTVYLPGLDLFSHATDDALEKQPIYFEEVVDPIIGKTLAAYQKAGVLDDTWIMFVSDHGHTPVLADKDHALEVDDFEKALEQSGFKMRPAFLEVDEKEFSAVLGAQGGLGYLYLADRSSCDEDTTCDWKARPRWKEDVLPAVEALTALNQDPEGLNGRLDAILTRDPRKPTSPFEVWEDGKLQPIDDWLAQGTLENQLELSQRIRDLTEGPYGDRAGEVIMIPHYGMHLPEGERYYFSMPVESEHGSATPEDSRFTLMVTRSGKSGEEIKQIVHEITGDTPHQKHVVPLALRLLGVEKPATAAR